MTIKSLLADATARLQQANVESPALDARLLLEHASGMSREALIANSDSLFEDVALHAQYETLLTRRIAREPLAQIIGAREFWSLSFRVTKDTLDPRADSETLIEAALSLIPGRGRPLRILDLGTGTGCLLIALLTEFPNATGIGLDISEAALAVAKENAKRIGVAARSEFFQGDWAAALREKFDLIVSNPPYIAEHEIAALAPEVARYEPKLALSGGADGLDAYRIIVSQAKDLLAPEGLLLFELGIGQADHVAEMLTQAGLNLAGTMNDLSGITRCLAAQNIFNT